MLVPSPASSEPPSYRISVDLGPRIRSLASADPFDREPAEDLLAGLGDQAVPPLATALETEEEAVRIGVIDVLSSLEADGVAPLLLRRARADASVDVRAAAISALIARQDAQAAEVVGTALGSDDPRLYRVALAGCPRWCGSPGSLARLVELAFAEPVRWMGGPRAALVRAIADPARRVAASQAIERAAAARLTDEDVETRVRAALLLSDLQDPRALSPLGLALDHDLAPSIRIQAMVALGALGDDAAASALARSLDSLPPVLRAAGCKALRSLARRAVDGAAAAASAHGCPG